MQKGRQERVEEGGRRVIQEPGNRVIVKQNDRAVIRHDEAERFRRRPDARTERRPDGVVSTVYARPDGTRVVTEVDANGRLIRRYRRGPDGREHNIIDNRRFWRNVAIGVGVGAAVGVAIVALAPPRVTIPREKYVVDYERASDDDLYEALDAPPVEDLERSYSLEEVRDNYPLRQRLRHIELVNINFELGAWELSPEQYPKLERLARAILRILRRNPDEVVPDRGSHRRGRLRRRQPEPVGPSRFRRRRGSDRHLRRAAREPRHPGLRRAVPEGQHAGRRAPQPPRRRAPHHPADVGALG